MQSGCLSGGDPIQRQLLEAFVSAAPTPFVLLNLEGDVQYWNDAAGEVFKWTSDSNPCPFPLIGNSAVGNGGKILDRLRQGEKLKGLELRHETGDADSLVLEFAAYPLSDIGGNICAVAAAFTDPRDRIARLREGRKFQEQLESLLVAMERRYSVLFETMVEGVVYVDAEGTIISANPAAEEILGLPLPEIIGRTCSDPCWQLLGKDYQPLPPDQLPALKALKTRRPVKGEKVAIFNRSRKEHRWLCINAVPLFAADSAFPASVYCTIKDYTEHKRTDDSLVETNEILQGIIAASPAAILTVDPDGIVQNWNPASERLFGWLKHEVLGKKLPTIPEGEKEDFPVQLGRLLQGEIYDNVVRRRQRKDGSLIDVSLSTAPLKDARGKITGTIGIYTDIMELKRVQDALSGERNFLQTIINGVIDPILVIDLDHRVLLLNDAAKNTITTLPANYTGMKCHQLFHKCDRPCSEFNFSCVIKEVGHTGKSVTLIKKQPLSDGRERCFEISASPLLDNEGNVSGVIEISRDITQRLEAEALIREKDERLHYLAFHDSLTHLPNRALFTDRLQHAISRARRTDSQVALLYLDLDFFKKINDTLGHHKGDMVLCEVARRLRLIVRESDTIARIGGDDFAFVLEQPGDVNAVLRVAHKILQTVSDVILIDSYRLYVTGSVGISIFPADGQDPEGLVAAAEVAMYKAKDKGRGECRIYSPDMNSRARDNFLMEANLRDAIAQNQLVLYYQPIIDLASGAPVGAESLIRWIHPEKGIIPPGDFIPLAEETGLIVPIGEQVLYSACRQVRAWMHAGHLQLTVAVNVSARQFRQSNLVEMVENVLRETKVPPRLLQLEITESTIMNDVQSAIHVMKELNGMGVDLIIDDFGTGYSSLNYLRKFPIKKLKIDYGFVSEICTDENNAAIATAVIALAHSMHLKVVAEGIETIDQLNWLRDRNCDFGQGYYYSRPVPPEKYVEYLTRQSK